MIYLHFNVDGTKEDAKEIFLLRNEMGETLIVNVEFYSALRNEILASSRGGKNSSAVRESALIFIQDVYNNTDIHN
jgi:hypothetical protein